jgi:signal transduction histidine kinase
MSYFVNKPQKIDTSNIFLPKLFSNRKWKPVNNIEKLPEIKKGNDFWLCVKIPSNSITNAGIYFGSITNPMQIYLDSALVYSYGSFNSSKKKSGGWFWRLVSLPDVTSNKSLTFHIQVNNSEKAIISPILLGASSHLKLRLYNKYLMDILIVIQILFISLIAIPVVFYLRKAKEYIGAIIFIIAIGLWVFVNIPLTHILFNFPLTIFYIDLISLYTQIIGFTLFVKSFVPVKYQSIFNKLLYAQSAFLIFALIMDVIFAFPLNRLLPLFFVLALLTGIVTLVYAFKFARKGDYKAKLFLTGMGFFVFSFVLEIADYLQKEKNFYSVRYIQYGLLILIIFMLWISVKDYFDKSRESKLAQKKALENEKLAGAAVRREKEVREKFSQQLINDREKELEKIATALHDGLGQELIVVKNRLLLAESGVEVEEQIKESIDILSKSISGVSHLSHFLRPVELDQLGLTLAVESMIERIENSTKIRFETNLENLDECIDKKNAINLFRIFQEAINNIVKHSDADKVNVDSAITNDLLKITIEDNGKGLALSAKHQNNNRPHLGIAGIEERVRILNGNLDITSDESGTIISLTIPIYN